MARPNVVEHLHQALLLQGMAPVSVTAAGVYAWSKVIAVAPDGGELHLGVIVGLHPVSGGWQPAAIMVARDPDGNEADAGIVLGPPTWAVLDAVREWQERHASDVNLFDPLIFPQGDDSPL